MTTYLQVSYFFCARDISSSLASLFNRSFAEGSLPLEWKQALVVPVFKRGDKSLPTNYRPISLLSIVSKVIERIVYNKLYSFLSPLFPHGNQDFVNLTVPNFNCCALFNVGVSFWTSLVTLELYSLICAKPLTRSGTAVLLQNLKQQEFLMEHLHGFSVIYQIGLNAQ